MIDDINAELWADASGNWDALTKEISDLIMAKVKSRKGWHELWIECKSSRVRMKLRQWASNQGLKVVDMGSPGLVNGVVLVWGERCPIITRPDICVDANAKIIHAGS